MKKRKKFRNRFTSMSVRKNCFICTFWEKTNISTVAIFHDNWHSFSIRSELQSFQYFILQNWTIKLDLWKAPGKNEKKNYFIISTNSFILFLTVKSKRLLPRILAFLLTKTICNCAAAWTRASSSWDCALYKIAPALLQKTSFKMMLTAYNLKESWNEPFAMTWIRRRISRPDSTKEEATITFSQVLQYYIQPWL